MTDLECIIGIPELQILLNLMQWPISLKYPLYDFDIASMKPTGRGFSLQGLCTREDFDEAVSVFGDYSFDMPAYANVMQAMLTAGVLQYRNEAGFQDLKKGYRAMNKEVTFSLDTNMLYDGFPSRQGMDLSYLLVDLVQSEIEAAINVKYSPHTISDLKRMAPFEGKVLDQLINQKMKRSRVASYNALSEFQKIRDHAVMVKGIEPAGFDKEKNDLVIIKSVKNYAKESYSLPVHLTADVNAAELCRAEGIAHYLFEYPTGIDVSECSPAGAIELIFRLAIACGVIKCNSALIYGEYKGKGGRKQDLKVVFRNPDLYELFKRELTLCRSLSQLPLET